MNFGDILYKVTHWETWHYVVKYIPLAPVWIWYCIRSRNLWFFTASNPTLTFGGFEGEGKKEMYEQLPPGTYPRTIYIDPELSISQVEQTIASNNFEYPFIVKPDIGMMGFMVRKISTREQLAQYHSTMPKQYIVQLLVDYPVEVAIFYYRFPHEKRGTVSGMLKKEPAYVIGDGKNILLDLMESNRNIRYKLEDIKKRNERQLNLVLPKGEKFYLSLASNRSQGGLVEGIDHEIDENLQTQLDYWSNYSGNFFYGRYDIKCASVESLKNGKDFYILEFNGAGAGIQHITANNYTLFKAQSIILHHWKMMYKIGSLNRKKGVQNWGTLEGARFLNDARKNLLMLKKMDAEFPSF